MNALLLSQFNTVFIFFLTGICIGLLFDFFRIQRKVLKTCDFITYIQDILFWIVSGLIISTSSDLTLTTTMFFSSLYRTSPSFNT